MIKNHCLLKINKNEYEKCHPTDTKVAVNVKKRIEFNLQVCDLCIAC